MNEFVKQYRKSRKGREDYRLTNTVILIGDMLIRLAGGHYTPEQETNVWEMVEKLIVQYADGREDA